jgi:hypothetical protein
VLVVALSVPGAFADDAVLFGAAYLLVRLLHLVLSAIVARDDPDRRGALLPRVLGHVAFLFRTTGRVFRRRTVGTVVLLALLPAALTIPALAALALVSAVCSLIVVYEAIRYREHRIRVRHPELAA